MTDYRYPYGYSASGGGGVMLTWSEMMTKKTVYNLHPEVQRRFHALIEYAASCGVPLGVGTGWRVQPDPPPPGFAKPGNSWHESCPCSPQTATALAIDTVPNASWPWMEDHCAAYGLRTFKYVGNEPWHVQPTEISASRRYATVMPPLQTWPLPGASPTPQPPTPTPEEDDDVKPMLTRASDQSIWVVAGDLSSRTMVSQAQHDSLKGTGGYAVVAFQQEDLDRVPVAT